MPATLSPRETTIGQRDLRHWRTPAGRWLAGVAQRLDDALGPRAVLLLPLVLGGALLALTAWLSSETYESVRDKAGLTALDHPVLEMMKHARSTPLNWLAIGFTQTGGPIGMPIIAALVTIYLAKQWKSWTPVVLMVIAVAGSLTATVVGKRVVGRMRPPVADAVPPYEHALTASFPSGHTLNSVVIGGMIAYLLMIHATRQSARWWTLVLATLYALCMGLSRVYLGHHWLSDVVFAWLLGLAWLTVLITAHRLFLTVWQRHHPVPQVEPATT